MTTNTYQALCDSVGAYSYHDACKMQIDYEEKGLSFSKFEADCPQKGHCTTECKQAFDLKIHPPATAEQRERLKELILNEGWTLICWKLGKNPEGCVYYIQAEKGVGKQRKIIQTQTANNTKSSELYALTHKLVSEAVLSKEEVAKALKGGE